MTYKFVQATDGSLSLVNKITGTTVMSFSVADAITVGNGALSAMSRGTLAAAGNSAGTAAVIVNQVTAVTGADNAKAVALPAAATTTGPFLIINTSASATLPVYPVNGGNDNINSLAEDAAFTMGPGKAAWFIPTSATQYYVDEDAAITASYLEINKLTGATFSVAEANTLTGVPVSVTGAAVSAQGTVSAQFIFLNAAGTTGITTSFQGVAHISTTALGNDYGVVSGITAATNGALVAPSSGTFIFTTTTSGRLGVNITNGASTSYISFTLPGGKVKVSPAMITTA